ncbi:MAG: serine--tRNA ligase, partial [Alistipes sp.]|nr:serine--tRNA ligase [Alistipes sp.]
MLTLKQLRENKEEAIRRLAKKGVDAAPIIARIETLDDKRKALQVELDNCLAAQNAAAKQIGALMAKGERDAAEAKKAEVAGLKTRSQQLKEEADRAAEELQNEIVLLPNMPSDIVPEGRTAEDNVIVKLVERESKISGEALPHWELAKKYDIIDFDLGVKLTGAGFPVYKGKGARLQRALINYFLDCNTAAGYQEVEPPIMVNEASGFGTGQLPDKEGQMYHAT